MKQRAGQRKPAASYGLTTIYKNTRATLSSTQHIRKNKYRLDLRMAAIHRSSATLCSQKHVMVKRRQTCPPRAPECLPPPE
ncbi:60S ribosomal protein L28 [Camelus ferus]|nr:60S ribosomal protein L28 [Camelus ferus]